VNAPPKMIPFDMVSHCFGCEGKFNTVFRRPSHCRNCGVCICASCSTAWSKAMVPETYNYKNARTIKLPRKDAVLMKDDSDVTRMVARGEMDRVKKDMRCTGSESIWRSMVDESFKYYFLLDHVCNKLVGSSTYSILLLCYFHVLWFQFHEQPQAKTNVTPFAAWQPSIFNKSKRTAWMKERDKKKRRTRRRCCSDHEDPRAASKVSCQFHG
jgi:hypothetical protein